MVDSTTVRNDEITKHRNMYKNDPVQNTRNKGEVRKKEGGKKEIFFLASLKKISAVKSYFLAGILFLHVIAPINIVYFLFKALI